MRLLQVCWWGLSFSFYLAVLYYLLSNGQVSVSPSPLKRVFPLKNPPTFNLSLYPSVKDTFQDYPPFIPLLTVLERWNPDSPDIPTDFTEVLQHFNYSNEFERTLALQYRDAEIPFKLYDVPMVNNVSQIWSEQYLSHHFDSTRYHVEESSTNHFMYWSSSKKQSTKSFKRTTRDVSNFINFDSWSKFAHEADSEKNSANTTHYYFMTGSRRSDVEKNFVHKDLPLFREESGNFFIPTPKYNKGIQCRFGMRGVIAESHYDSGRNSIAMIRGSKRYILTPPESCKYLAIISDKKHPSFRHSMIDWSNLNQARAHSFHLVKSVETVLRAGELLYLPSFWFHYIVSLNYSIQCNSRSGFPKKKYGKAVIERCMKIKIRS